MDVIKIPWWAWAVAFMSSLMSGGVAGWAARHFFGVTVAESNIPAMIAAGLAGGTVLRFLGQLHVRRTLLKEDPQRRRERDIFS